MNGGDEWLSIRAAGDVLGLNTRTVYGCIDRGELTAYRFGRVYRCRRADVDAYMMSCRVQPGDLAHLTYLQ